MTPKRPYLLRAFYQWILDNNMTPYITVDATVDEVSVPRQHIKDGRIVLNISPTAVRDFVMDNDAVSFSARFGGVAFYVYCPVYSVLAIYSRESQDGASFPPEEYAQRAKLAEVKAGGPVLAAVPTTDGADAGSSDDSPKPTGTGKPSSKSRPALRVVK